MKRELGCLVHLTHPNIVGVHGHGRFPDFETGWLYVLLTFVEGYTLAEWVERMHPTAQEVVRLADPEAIRLADPATNSLGDPTAIHYPGPSHASVRLGVDHAR
ncbi:hypothetical protein [Corallococcus exiguus]|uniref:hypothetical protein n=1 Tax=Corallococcus exiguus TaxID=83462 RepID=UPI002016819B|nr:hypothetical protein [Corallococcus exiguus]